MMAPDQTLHEPTGLVLQEVTGIGGLVYMEHEIKLPPMCPVSGNPQEGSVLTLSYSARSAVLEVYALAKLPDRFVGGFTGDGKYPSERNMEGAVRTMAKMASDALGLNVRFRADLVLDAGRMVVSGVATPQDRYRE